MRNFCGATRENPPPHAQNYLYCVRWHTPPPLGADRAGMPDAREKRAAILSGQLSALALEERGKSADAVTLLRGDTQSKATSNR
jgi:hypothetical protein